MTEKSKPTNIITQVIERQMMVVENAHKIVNKEIEASFGGSIPSSEETEFERHRLMEASGTLYETKYRLARIKGQQLKEFIG